MSGRKVFVVTPCRDEAKYAERCAQSILAQTEAPARWLIVDDGSSDATVAILRRVTAGHSNVEIVRKVDAGSRQLGGGVVRAFNFGLNQLDLAEADYICKMDLDLDLPSEYFATALDLMESEPRLGSVSGKPFYTRGGRRHWEVCGDENSVGMVKLYRREAFMQIGGLVPELMWDAIDCHEMRRRGWISRSVSRPELAFEHLRPMGSSDRSIVRGRVRHGRGQWFMGTSIVFLIASALRRICEPPAVGGSLAMTWGFLHALASRMPRYGERAFRRDVRRYQRESLIIGKRRAAARWEKRRAGAWLSEAAKCNDQSPT